MTTLTTDTRRVIYRRPEALVDTSTHYCPGCGHGRGRFHPRHGRAQP